jgi:starch synthase
LKELFVEATGLQNLFRDEAGKAHGRVNGIDPLYWNPKLDPLISFNYGTSTATRGKQANKKVLCKEYGLPADVPLLSFIGRFAAEKGADKLGEIIRKLFSQNKYKIAIFILGSGDRGIEAEMGVLKETYADNLATYIGYNEALAHEVYAASDMLLMPSRVEPCGLNQLYALQYGTVPIVRGIGGLKDTVKDNSETGGYGFVFEHLDSSEAVDTIIRALEIYQDTKQWRAIRKRAMQLDFSWESSARKYLDLYDQL